MVTGRTLALGAASFDFEGAAVAKPLGSTQIAAGESGLLNDKGPPFSLFEAPDANRGSAMGQQGE